ncbi:hypothetical protein OG216_19595 [Streptomycetaceae bacterium NBC_01309]
MVNPTDPTWLDPEPTVQDVLLGVATHLTQTNPTAALESYTVLVCVGAEAYKQTDRRTDGVARALAQAAMTVVPEPPRAVTRGEYALWLRKVVASQNEWTEADNEPVIPSVTADFPKQRSNPGPDC